MSQTVKEGNTISVEYTGKFEDGEVFDTSRGKQPLSFTVGAGQLIPGFDSAVVDMAAGDQRTVTIEPKNGYGDYREDLLISMPKTNIPSDMDLEIGMMVNLTNKEGNPVPAKVKGLEEESVSLDVNHPLAGKTLVFEIEVVSIDK